MIDPTGSKESNDERSAAFDGSCRTGERPKTCRQQPQLSARSLRPLPLTKPPSTRPIECHETCHSFTSGMQVGEGWPWPIAGSWLKGDLAG